MIFPLFRQFVYAFYTIHLISSLHPPSAPLPSPPFLLSSRVWEGNLVRSKLNYCFSVFGGNKLFLMNFPRRHFHKLELSRNYNWINCWNYNFINFYMFNEKFTMLLVLHFFIKLFNLVGKYMFFSPFNFSFLFKIFSKLFKKIFYQFDQWKYKDGDQCEKKENEEGSMWVYRRGGGINVSIWKVRGD